MTLPDEYLKLVGAGPVVKVGDKEYFAYPLTIAEQIKYQSMRPNNHRIDKTPEGQNVVVYDSAEDRARDQRSMAYILWCTLRRNDDTGAKVASFEEWVGTQPYGVILAYQGLIAAVMMSTMEPFQKKN